MPGYYTSNFGPRIDVTLPGCVGLPRNPGQTVLVNFHATRTNPSDCYIGTGTALSLNTDYYTYVTATPSSVCPTDAYTSACHLIYFKDGDCYGEPYPVPSTRRKVADQVSLLVASTDQICVITNT